MFPLLQATALHEGGAATVGICGLGWGAEAAVTIAASADWVSVRAPEQPFPLLELPSAFGLAVAGSGGGLSSEWAHEAATLICASLLHHRRIVPPSPHS